jgi:hypothetical protein
MPDLAAETQSAEMPADGPEAPAEALPVMFEPAAPEGPQWSLASVMAISFSLTFVIVSVALLAGLLPATLTAGLPVDLGVLLLIVPLSALVLAITGETLHAALRGVPDTRVRRTAIALSGWRPGSREG